MPRCSLLVLMALAACAPRSPPQSAGDERPACASEVALPAGAHALRHSADGGSIVYVRATRGGGQIVVARADGSEARALTDGADDRDPVFTPDGDTVVFASKRAGTFDLWSVARDGSALRRLTELPGDERRPDVSPGRYEVVHGLRSGVSDRTLTAVASYHKIAYERCDAKRCRIAFVSDDGVAHGEISEEIAGDCRQPRWAPSTREMAYVCDGALRWVEQPAFRSGYIATPGVGAAAPRWQDAAAQFPEEAPQDLPTVASFEGFTLGAISPNGVWLAAEREGALWLLHRDGKQRRRIASAAGFSSWSPDGRQLRLLDQGAAGAPTLCTRASELALSDVANLWAFPEFYDVARGSLLDKQGFALFDAAARDFAGTWGEWERFPGAPELEPFDRARLITSDAILDALHVAFDGAMLRIERDTLAPRLRELLAQLSARAAAQHAASPRAQRLAVLLGVAHALASSEDVPSAAPSIGAPTVRAAVERILATIAVATTSEANIHELADLQLRELDLSELEPRSHYDREGLRGFFRAVMWLSRARLEDAGAALDVYRWLGRGALRRSYSDIYQLYELFVGPAEDGSLMTFAAMEAEQPALFRGERGAIVAAAEARLGGPSALPSAEGANAHRKRFYLFPARLTPDAEVMQSLSFSGRARSTRKPSALDVMAVLGSSRAALHASEQQGFPFDATVAKLRGRALFGHEGSYGTWLAALQTMLVDGAGVHATSAHDGSAALPAFARTTAYRDKLLHTALASYAALKHDTLLATKPPRVRMGGVQHSDEWLVEHLVMPRALIYVEPTPGLYEQLARYTERIEAAMRAIGPDATAAQRRFARLRAELVRPLQEALERQLRHEPLDDALHAELATIAHWLRSNWYAEGGGALIGPDRPTGGPCLVADIWSDADRKLLHAIAIGDVLPMAAVVVDGGRNVITLGGAYSYYQLDMPIHERPTDSAWCTRVHDGNAPPRPSWTKTFIQRHW